VLFPTEKGMALISVVHDMLKSPELTGKWEQKLKDIENGEYPVERFNHAIETFVAKLIPRVAQSPVLSYRDPEKKRPGAKQGSDRRPDSDAAAAPPPAAPAAKTEKAASRQAPDGYGTCPRCGEGTVIEGRAAYGCNRFREGCRLTFPKAFLGKTLSDKQVRDLVAKGKTGVIKGWKDGDAEFSGRLVWDAGDNPRVERAEAAKAKPLNTLPCPKCGKGTIMEGKRGYGCDRFRDGCTFVVWKEIEGKTLTEAQVRALVTKGKTGKISGFQRGGTTLSGKLVLDGNHQVVLQAETPS